MQPGGGQQKIAAAAAGGRSSVNGDGRRTRLGCGRYDRDRGPDSRNVALMFVDDESGFDAQSFQRMPEFVGLRSRAFAVASRPRGSALVF